MAMVPHERSLVEKYRDKPFVLLGVNCDADVDAAKRVISKKRINWRNWVDGRGANGSISNHWGVQALPTLYFIDHKGVIRIEEIGFLDGSDLESKIDQLLAKREKDLSAK